MRPLFMPKCVVTTPYFDWGNDGHPRTQWHETIIYEVLANSRCTREKRWCSIKRVDPRRKEGRLYKDLPTRRKHRLGQTMLSTDAIEDAKLRYSVVLPSKCSSWESASALVLWIVPSRCSGGE